MPAPGPPCGDLKQQGGLSHPGFSSEQHHNPWDQAVAQDTVQLGNSGAGMSCQSGVDLADRDRLADRNR